MKSSPWSTPSLFELASSPSEDEFEAALYIVRQFVSEGREEASSDNQEASSPDEQSPRRAVSRLEVSVASAPSTPAAAGDSDLMINGAAVVMTATLAGALCSTTEVRFLDLGDGTVLDCNTGKMWLKDASCWASTRTRSATG